MVPVVDSAFNSRRPSLPFTARQHKLQLGIISGGLGTRPLLLAQDGHPCPGAHAVNVVRRRR